MSLILSGTDGLSDVDGSAATPAIRGTDANTGIFFGTDIIGFSEGGVEAMRINASGNLQTIATIGVGNATPSTSGAGITFPSGDTHYSSNANTLDDYEEGTWMPFVAGNVVAGSATYSTQIGTYTKVGNLVNVRFKIVTTSVLTGGSSVILITGLPFGAGGAEQSSGGGSITSISTLGSAVNTSNLYTDAGATYLVPAYVASGTSNTFWSISTIANGAGIVGTATYYT